MAYKIVDAAKLDACQLAEADAIRAKTGGAAPIPYDWENSKGFSDAIAAIPTGGNTPTEIKRISIIENGITMEDVTNYANVEIAVDVATSGGASISEYATGAWPTGAITLASSIQTTAAWAFSHTSITSFNAPELLALSEYGLRDCKSLTSINLPKVTRIGRAASTAYEGYALSGCTELQVIYLPECLTAHGGYNLNGLGKTGAFVTIVLPKLTAMGGHLFRGCKAEAVDLGPNVTALSGYNFYGGTYNNIILRCTSGVVSANTTAISSLNASSKVHVPSALVASYEVDSVWGAKGSIFYPIEGGIYENAYADGTPIAA